MGIPYAIADRHRFAIIANDNNNNNFIMKINRKTSFFRVVYRTFRKLIHLYNIIMYREIKIVCNRK